MPVFPDMSGCDKNLVENDNVVTEHGLSSEITQSPSGSSDTSEGSKNSRSFEDSERLDKEYSEDGASYMEGGSETPQITSRKEGITKIVNVQAQKRGFSASWAERKPKVQIKGNSIQTDSSIEAMVDDILVACSDMAEFNKPKW
ncbi:hypothetical protein Tco_0120975 [Tanacetum coccineum]